MAELNNQYIKKEMDINKIKELLKLGLFASFLAFSGNMILGWGLKDERLTGILRELSLYSRLSNSRLFAGALLGLLGIFIQGLSYDGIYRLIEYKSKGHAKIFKSGVLGYIGFGACGVHVSLTALAYSNKYMQEHGIAVQTATSFAVIYITFFLLPSILIFFLSVIVLSAAQISAFINEFTPYPKWCSIFSLPLGMFMGILFSLFGNTEFANALSSAFLSIGNIIMFAGLLLAMPSTVNNEPLAI
ncbi:hypothetical protein SAMN05216249_11381 [Acetitomaculum ruminis DSM 5522]|uniref:Uncharacterized protein n=1 Tax=Acetitomaculum ruminis DSM 5522 TaxID=1120918 RepID=A0A1I0Z7S8_9FIRM|nr:DUF6796 family protein [Acetitomaculum ruminis]SFB21695.1 hypothetical protein SAMN05216249_11381 [Acetitomaculum ruminis DSM 5522]